MLRTLSIGAIIGIFVMLTGCQSEDQREAAQRRREAEARTLLQGQALRLAGYCCWA